MTRSVQELQAPMIGLRRRSPMATLRVLSNAAGDIARHQKLSAALVFWTKTLRDPESVANWIEYIVKHYTDNHARPPNVRTLRKPQRNYGVTGRSVAGRVAALINHYEFTSTHLSAATHKALLSAEQVAIGSIEARGATFGLWLGSSMPFGQKQEGELTVWLTNSDGVSLARMAFSIGLDRDQRAAVLIGGLQGLPAGVDKKLIVTATRTLSGLRPKDAVLVGVQAVAKALGIERVLAVSNQTHVLATEWFMSDSVISRDYDGFWKERGGEAEPDVGFSLPARDYRGRAAAPNSRIIDRHRAALTERVLATLAVR